MTHFPSYYSYYPVHSPRIFFFLSAKGFASESSLSGFLFCLEAFSSLEEELS